MDHAAAALRAAQDVVPRDALVQVVFRDTLPGGFRTTSALTILFAP